MKYLIYKTTNVINGKYYVGAHKTSNIKDGYKGSGTILKQAFKEHGRKNFICEILEECVSEEHMYKRESALVTKELVEDRNTYHIATGGRGGPGTPKSEEHKQKLRDNHRHLSNPGAGRKPAMDPKELVTLCDTHGKSKAAEMLGISIVACRSRYHRLKNKI